MFLLLHRPAFNPTTEKDKSDKNIWTQHNILSHCLVNTRIGQDTTLKAFPKPQHYKGASPFSLFSIISKTYRKENNVGTFC